MCIRDRSISPPHVNRHIAQIPQFFLAIVPKRKKAPEQDELLPSNPAGLPLSLIHILYAAFLFVAVFVGYAVGSAPIVSFHYGARNLSLIHI